MQETTTVHNYNSSSMPANNVVNIEACSASIFSSKPSSETASTAARLGKSDHVGTGPQALHVEKKRPRSPQFSVGWELIGRHEIEGEQLGRIPGRPRRRLRLPRPLVRTLKPTPSCRFWSRVRASVSCNIPKTSFGCKLLRRQASCVYEWQC